MGDKKTVRFIVNIPKVKSVASSQRIKDAVLEVRGASAPKRRVSSPKKPLTKAPKSIEKALRPAVVATLKKSIEPLRVAEVYDALVQQGYQFTVKKAKKVLGIRHVQTARPSTSRRRTV